LARGGEHRLPQRRFALLALPGLPGRLRHGSQPLQDMNDVHNMNYVRIWQRECHLKALQPSPT
ncbi:MAG TPA: hypothetical protein VF705_12045, partial [Longimicrobium sp.]